MSIGTLNVLQTSVFPTGTDHGSTWVPFLNHLWSASPCHRRSGRDVPISHVYLLGFCFIPYPYSSPIFFQIPTIDEISHFFYFIDDSIISLHNVISCRWSKIPKPGADWSMLRDSPSGALGCGRYQMKFAEHLELEGGQWSISHGWKPVVYGMMSMHMQMMIGSNTCVAGIHKFWSRLKKRNKEFHFWECPPLFDPSPVKKWQH